jgi:hypothetical protein
VDGGDDRLAPRHLLGRRGQLGAGGGVSRAGGVERLAADDLTGADQRLEQWPVVTVVDRGLADADHLRLGDTGRAAPP